MSQLRTLTLIGALAAALIPGRPAAAQQQVQDRTVTVQALLNGEPTAGVSIYVLAGANKFSPTTPPAATTDSSGNASVLLPGLLSPNKPHTQLEIWVQRCINGKKIIFIIPVGAENLLPPDTNDCKKQRVGLGWFDGGGYWTVEIGQNPGVTQTGGGPAVTPPPHRPLWGEAQIYGGEISTDSDIRSYKFGAALALLFRLGALGSIGPGIGIENRGFVSLASIGGETGGTFEKKDFSSFDILYDGVWKSPDFHGFGLGISGGADQFLSTERIAEGVCGGTTSTGPTSGGCVVLFSSRMHDTLFGYDGGAEVFFPLVPAWHNVKGFVAYRYHRLDDSGIDLHLHEVYGGLDFCIFGCPRP